MDLWKPFIEQFGLNFKTICTKRSFYTESFAEQLHRCKDDDCRRVLLGIEVPFD
jgi:hypothetical protein